MAAINPGTIKLGLTIGSILAKLGQGYFAGRDLDTAQREQDRRVGYSNLINTFGGRSTPSPVELKPGRATTILGGLGTALSAGSMLYDLADAKKLRDLQMENIQGQIDTRKLSEDITRGTTLGMGAGLPQTDTIAPKLSAPGGGGAAGRADPSRFMPQPQRTIAPSRVSPATITMGGGVAPPDLSDVGQAAFSAAQAQRLAGQAAARTAAQQQALDNYIALSNALSKEQDLDLKLRIFEQKIGEVNKLPLKDRLAAEGVLRKEFNGLTSDFRSVGDSFNTILAGADDPTAVTDLSLIFAFMKMLDPTSVVRESEFKAAEGAAGFNDKAQNAWAKFWDGERLTVNRKDFLNQAKNVYDARLPGYVTLVEKYGSIAGREGLNVQNVLTDYRVNLDRFNKVMGAQMPEVGISGGVDLDLLRNWNQLAPGQGVLRQ